MLQAIVSVTLTTDHLQDTAAIYGRWLGFKPAATGRIPPQLAALWNRPAMGGKPFQLLQPASNCGVYLRLIESVADSSYVALRDLGWNANEMLARDPEQLARSLRTSAFTIVGEPRPLTMNPAVVAMQARGPCGEINYFTRLPGDGRSLLDCTAESFVDRTFIVVCAATSMARMSEFYGATLGLATTDIIDARIELINRALDRPIDETRPMRLARVGRDFLIELDEYPSDTAARRWPADNLPAGIGMVSFRAAPGSGSRLSRLPWLRSPQPIAEPPYGGCHAGVLVGPGGELVEVISAD
ncbi:MAG: hypothetical protein R3E77_09600 [Steroidobacteraceae bacterium]